MDFVRRLASEHSGDTEAFAKACVKDWLKVERALLARGWTTDSVTKFNLDCLTYNKLQPHISLEQR